MATSKVVSSKTVWPACTVNLRTSLSDVEPAMLPSVPATSVAQTLQANQRQQSTKQVVASAPAQDNNVPASARPNMTGKTSSMELLGLSGQMRLSQSLSVFAETLGSLLKLPRREGEALADYSKRLASAISALDAGERARLQTQLNQIMQGATLRLLAELLKDPSGPAAARLAVQIEIASYQERDLAARHAVSSYRQNNGSDLPPSPANTNPASAQTLIGTTRITSHDAGNGSSNQEGSDAGTGVSSRLTGSATTRISADAAVATAANRSASDVFTQTETTRGGSETAAKQATEDAADPEPVKKLPTEDRLATNKSQPATGSDADHSLQQTRNESASQNEKPSVNATLDSEKRPAKPATIYDAAALARQAHDGLEPNSPLTKALIEHFQAEWVAELAKPDAEDGKLPKNIISLDGIAPGLDEEGVDASTDAESNIVKQTAAKSQENSDLPEAIVSIIPTTANHVSLSATIAAQPDTAFEKALLGMTLLPREVPAHPLVPQAATQEFDDAQDHEIKRKSPVGDEDQPPQREHQGFHRQSGGDDQNAAGEEQQAEPMPLDDGITHIDEPEPTSATTDPKRAPRQHLSDHPAASAEDLYRRLASLE